MLIIDDMTQDKNTQYQSFVGKQGIQQSWTDIYQLCRIWHLSLNLNFASLLEEVLIFFICVFQIELLSQVSAYLSESSISVPTS